MKQICTFLASLFVAGISIAQPVKPDTKCLPYDVAGIPREHNVDFKHLRLEASFDAQKGIVFGKVTHIFSPIQKVVDTIFLDAPGIRIKEVLHRGKALPYSISPKGVTLRFNPALTWDITDSVTISYEAKPRKGIYFIGWNDPKNISRKQIWSQGQGIDNRYWIPMYDEMNDKITSELIITMPKPYKVLSNGVRVGLSDKGAEQVWHYKMSKPHAPYLIMLGIGDYEIETRTNKSGVVSDLWYYPDWKNRVKTTYAHSTEMMDYFESEIGVAYPWEKYSQIPVQDFLYGAMENTTATTFGDFFFVDERGELDRGYVGVNAHELAHQWFGDMVTARSSIHAWLQESFATHYNMLYERIAFGQDYFDMARRRANIGALRASEADLYPIVHTKAGGTRIYPKGAVVLEMLKYVVGREAYNRAIKHYLNKHAYSNVDTEDLMVAFHETLGLSLDWFWEQWLYRGGEPFYLVNTEISGNSFVFDVKQTQEVGPYTGYFRMPIVFEVHFTDGTSVSKKAWVDGKETRVTIDLPAGKTIAYTLFDPNSEVMKSVTFEKPFEQLKAQAISAKYMLDRLDAVQAMEVHPIDLKRSVLQQVLKADNYYTVKAAALKQLADDKKSRTFIKAALKDKDVQIRKAAVGLYDTIPADLIKDVENLLSEPSYDLQNEVLTKLAKSKPGNVKAYLAKTAADKGNITHNVRITWLKLAIQSGETKHVQELVDYGSGSYEFGTRRNAMNALRDLNMFSAEIASNAIDAAYNPNGKLSGWAVSFLNWAYNERAEWKQLIEAQSSNATEEWQLEVWSNIRAEKK